jgi:peptide deformylase
MPGEVMEILLYPNPLLRKPAEVVRELGDIGEKSEEMFRIMYDHKGVGLAATQVGLDQRFFIMNAGGTPAKDLVLVNPVIVEGKGELVTEEGCLSLPGLEMKLPRYEWVKVRGTTLDGAEIELEGDGVFARAVQHELDHLNGTLIIDKVSPALRIALRPRLREMEKRFRAKK